MIGIDQILAEDKDPYKKWGAKFLAGNMWGVATFILGLAATYISVHQWRPVKKLGMFHLTLETHISKGVHQIILTT